MWTLKYLRNILCWKEGYWSFSFIFKWYWMCQGSGSPLPGVCVLTLGSPWAAKRVRSVSSGWQATVAEQAASPPQTKCTPGVWQLYCEFLCTNSVRVSNVANCWCGQHLVTVASQQHKVTIYSRWLHVRGLIWSVQIAAWLTLVFQLLVRLYFKGSLLHWCA